MGEIIVEQRTKQWFDLRRSVCVTASRFGDAVGVGKGKPYDFLESVIFPSEPEEPSAPCIHGIEFESVIDTAYQRITGRITQPSGFWLMADKEDPLYGLIGASPDGKVYEKDDLSMCIGLTEYKAPMYRMYTEHAIQLHGIPRQYMIQMQGQMAVCRQSWCDFMAICAKTQEICLRRVHFSPSYWSYVSKRLLEFCTAVKIAQQRVNNGVEPIFDFHEAAVVQSFGLATELFPGERDIYVEDLLETSVSLIGDTMPQKITVYRLKGATRNNWLDYDDIIDVIPYEDYESAAIS